MNRPAKLRSQPTSPATRGFTLVELMVALSGGLFVSLAVFALARDGSRFYQRESRLANATLGALVGFQRLRADLGRAGFMSTPNIRRDPFVCSKPAAGWPGGLTNLASVRITQGGSTANASLTANNRAPDRIVLSGAYSSSDEFPIRTVLQATSSYQVYLQANSGPMGRIGYPNTADSAVQATLLDAVFGAGRLLRIVDNSGMQHFGVISSVTGGASPYVTLAMSPPLQFRSGSTAACGLRGNETGATANVVNTVQYDLRNLSADLNFSAYSSLYASNIAAPYDSDRTELARIELNAAGSPIPGTGELIAEYAVDLKFGYEVANAIVGGTDPTLTYFAPGAAAFDNYAGDTLASPINAGPQLIRSLRVRLSVRSREADRAADVPDGGAANAGLYRFKVTPTGSTAQYARTRTFQADVALSNQGGVKWQ